MRVLCVLVACLGLFSANAVKVSTRGCPPSSFLEVNQEPTAAATATTAAATNPPAAATATTAAATNPPAAATATTAAATNPPASGSAAAAVDPSVDPAAKVSGAKSDGAPAGGGTAGAGEVPKTVTGSASSSGAAANNMGLESLSGGLPKPKKATLDPSNTYTIFTKPTPKPLKCPEPENADKYNAVKVHKAKSLDWKSIVKAQDAVASAKTDLAAFDKNTRPLMAAAAPGMAPNIAEDPVPHLAIALWKQKNGIGGDEDAADAPAAGSGSGSAE